MDKKKKKEKEKKYVAYYRVSTRKQSIGLEAQKTVVKKFLKENYPPIKSYTEKESGSKSDRPELHKALDYCYDYKCTLVVAKLDRLSRDLHFLTSIEKAKIDFICCDFPTMDKLQLHIMGSVAQWEREQISKRTSRALQELKSKGKRLGSHNPKVLRGLKRYWKKQKLLKKLHPTRTQPTPNKVKKRDKKVLPVIRLFRRYGLSYKDITKLLNDSKFPTVLGKRWYANQVNRVALRNGL